MAECINMANPFDEWPWGYCYECQKLICIGDEELMVPHSKGFTTGTYSPKPAPCPLSNHLPAYEVPDSAFDEQPITPFEYDENGDPV